MQWSFPSSCLVSDFTGILREKAKALCNKYSLLIFPVQLMWLTVKERRQSRGELNGDRDDDEEVEEDPKIQRELDEISKIKDESGMGKVIFQELAELKHKPPKAVDPWKASRVPSAKYEPRYHTRYQSPMFACKAWFSSVLCFVLQVFVCRWLGVLCTSSLTELNLCFVLC